MSEPRQLTLAVRIRCPQARLHVQRLIDELADSLVGPPSLLDVPRDCVFLRDDDETYRWFSSHIDERPGRFVILISDELVEREQEYRDDTWTYQPKQFTKELISQVEGHVATLALMASPQRVVDIDRTASTSCSIVDFRSAVTMCAARLDYMAPPTKQFNSANWRVQVRRIASMTELCGYFELRHSAYSVMGYLTPEIETCRSGMEINWNDRNSIPLGAFQELPGGREVIVGTARLALTQLGERHVCWDVLRTFERWTEELAQRDPITKSALDQPLMLELPIFHSLSRVISREMLTHGTSGELSRVIVAPDFRGAGISSQLVQQAMIEAETVGVRRVFLECLPVHAPLYERAGFQRMDTPSVNVISVKRTMVPMERPVTDKAEVAQRNSGHGEPRRPE